MAEWRTKDNSFESLKVKMRLDYLPKDPKVLDLYCGMGRMYKMVYRDRAKIYHGVDKSKVHDYSICTLADNTSFIKRHDISSYNVIDLDAYGCPWMNLYLVAQKHPGPNIVVFVTDGLVSHLRVNKWITKLISAFERLPRKMNIPGLDRFYLDMFGTMLLRIEKRCGWHITKAIYGKNGRGTVYYWVLLMQKK